jgi:hypothetical protein
MERRNGDPFLKSLIDQLEAMREERSELMLVTEKLLRFELTYAAPVREELLKSLKKQSDSSKSQKSRHEQGRSK